MATGFEMLVFRFTTPDLNYIGDLCVDFYYEAYGATVNQLTLYVQDGSDYGNHTNLWQIVGQQGNVWRRQSQNVHSTSLSLRVSQRFVLFVDIDNILKFNCVVSSEVVQMIFLWEDKGKLSSRWSLT